MAKEFEIDEKKFAAEFTRRVFEHSQDYVAVRTGRLKKSGKVSISGGKGKIEYSANYANIVESRGRRKRQKRGPIYEGRGSAFMQRAIEKTVQEIAEIAIIARK